MKEQSKLMKYLIEQCRHPTGFIGNLMINIWNKIFINMALWGLSHTHIQKTDTLLEIGCGGGTLINYLSKKNYVNKIYGVDSSKVAIQKATKLNRDFIESGKVLLLEDKAETLPFSKNIFNKVLVVQTHMYWTDLETATMRIFELLVRKGEFSIICEKDKIRYHLPQYVDKKDMTDMLKKIGFNKVQIFETNSWIHYLCIKGH